MSDNEPIAPLTREMTTRNIRLAGRFFEEVFENPDLLDEIADEATVVLMPPDDPELAQYNIRLAAMHGEAGRSVVIRRVGVPMPDVIAWRANERLSIDSQWLSPHWPTLIVPQMGDLVIVYDRDRDILLIDVFGLRREALGIPVSREVAARVELETEEIVGYLLLGFLASVVLRAPHLTSLLRVAEFRAITSDELGGLAPPEVGRPGPEVEREAAEALANEFSTLIA